ncbi:MAG: sugar nucleotide-binding protein [Pelolinea sp.]|nr:sugar nucleotide-binding protein [Pelolinea sp.]
MGVLRIVDDQISSPTWARMLAEATAQIIAQGRGEPVDYIKEKAGLYHLAGGGSCSRYEWARAILDMDPKKEEQVVKELLPAKTSEFPTPAMRPANTALDCSAFEKTFNLLLHSWQQTLLFTLQ